MTSQFIVKSLIVHMSLASYFKYSYYLYVGRSICTSDLNFTRLSNVI